MTTIQEMINVLNMIITDVENDVYEFEGRPFTGNTVAEYMGNQAACIQALAKIVKKHLIDEHSET